VLLAPSCTVPFEATFSASPLYTIPEAEQSRHKFSKNLPLPENVSIWNYAHMLLIQSCYNALAKKRLIVSYGHKNTSQNDIFPERDSNIDELTRNGHLAAFCLVGRTDGSVHCHKPNAFRVFYCEKMLCRWNLLHHVINHWKVIYNYYLNSLTLSELKLEGLTVT
jgi:hypothetical protein